MTLKVGDLVNVNESCEFEYYRGKSGYIRKVLRYDVDVVIDGKTVPLRKTEVDKYKI